MRAIKLRMESSKRLGCCSGFCSLVFPTNILFVKEEEELQSNYS